MLPNNPLRQSINSRVGIKVMYLPFKITKSICLKRFSYCLAHEIHAGSRLTKRPLAYFTFSFQRHEFGSFNFDTKHTNSDTSDCLKPPTSPRLAQKRV